MAKENAKERWGVDLEPTGHERLPFMGEHGCIVLPHLRPLCTLHVCHINGMGCKPGDAAWTKKYFELRDEIMELEYELCSEENSCQT